MSVEPGKSDEELLAEELAAEAERHERELAAQQATPAPPPKGALK